jgi:hypothetical protein
VTRYEISQYLKYWWQAKGRHGTHSPFVYSFVENVLRANNNDGPLANMLRYFQFNTIAHHGFGTSTELPRPLPAQPGTAPVLIFDKLEYVMNYTPDLEFMTRLLSEMPPEDVLLLQPIHKTSQQAQVWDLIKNAPNVKLSMDLFDMGIVFFRDEFKVRQHFILK